MFKKIIITVVVLVLCVPFYIVLNNILGPSLKEQRHELFVEFKHADSQKLNNLQMMYRDKTTAKRSTLKPPLNEEGNCLYKESFLIYHGDIREFSLMSDEIKMTYAFKIATIPVNQDWSQWSEFPKESYKTKSDIKLLMRYKVVKTD